jgi:hypothetical protein
MADCHRDPRLVLPQRTGKIISKVLAHRNLNVGGILLIGRCSPSFYSIELPREKIMKIPDKPANHDKEKNFDWWTFFDVMSGKLFGEVNSWGWKIYP